MTRVAFVSLSGDPGAAAGGRWMAVPYRGNNAVIMISTLRTGVDKRPRVSGRTGFTQFAPVRYRCIKSKSEDHNK